MEKVDTAYSSCLERCLSGHCQEPEEMLGLRGAIPLPSGNAGAFLLALLLLRSFRTNLDSPVDVNTEASGMAFFGKISCELEVNRAMYKWGFATSLNLTAYGGRPIVGCD